MLRCLARFVATQEDYIRVEYQDGRLQHIPGPLEVRFKWWQHQSIKVLKKSRNVASANQVLHILHRNGTVERKAGPAELWCDPLLYEQIEVQDLIRHIADENQYALVQYRDGRKELKRGPLEIVYDPFIHEKVEVKGLLRHIADQQQYLVVQYRDGRIEHCAGPVELCFNPFEHEKVQVHDAIRLAANEALVVYRRQQVRGEALVASTQILKPSGGGNIDETCTAFAGRDEESQHTHLIRAEGQEGAVHVERRLVFGPAIFRPDSEEWIHQFSWHGSIKNGKGSKTGYAGDEKVPHALNFSILRCMPDQIYYSVKDVRTSDDGKLISLFI